MKSHFSHQPYSQNSRWVTGYYSLLLNFMSPQVVQLEELLAVRHSVFVVGSAGTGKSQVLRSLYKTYQIMKRRPVWTDLNPKAVTNDELFGIINPATREWKDGKNGIPLGQSSCHILRACGRLKYSRVMRREHWTDLFGMRGGERNQRKEETDFGMEGNHSLSDVLFPWRLFQLPLERGHLRRLQQGRDSAVV